MCVIGLDPSSKKLAFAIIDDELSTYVVDGADIDDQYERLELFFSETEELLNTLTNEEVHLFYEQPLVGVGGVRISVLIAQAVTSPIMAALLSGAELHEVNVKTWKKVVVGNGNSSKDDVRAWVEDNEPGWASLCGGDQDLIDAACIAIYGQRLLAKSARIADGSAELG